MKLKEHRFILVVKTSDNRRGAELAVLAAFAQRKPDHCEFYLRRKPPRQPSLGYTLYDLPSGKPVNPKEI